MVKPQHGHQGIVFESHAPGRDAYVLGCAHDQMIARVSGDNVLCDLAHIERKACVRKRFHHVLMPKVPQVPTVLVRPAV